MKKTGIFNLILLLSPLIAGLYGVLHDQVTYTICPEYYTKFKFYQFGIIKFNSEAIVPNPRTAVATVGFLATWWTGIFVGLGTGLTALIHKDHKTMWKMACKATLITLIITLVTGFIGLAYGKIQLTHSGVNWWMPENLVDKENFIAVGSMHNFSYFGGAIGLITGIVYQLNEKRKFINKEKS